MHHLFKIKIKYTLKDSYDLVHKTSFLQELATSLSPSYRCDGIHRNIFL